MTEILSLLGALIVGASGKALVDWLRFKNVDSATAAKQHAEAASKLHDSDTNALQVSAGLLAVWMKNASDAEKKIIDLSGRAAKCTCGVFIG